MVLQVTTDDAMCVGEGDGGVPVWSPDGTTLAYRSPGGAIQTVALSGLDKPTALIHTNAEVAPIAWVDTTHLLYVSYPLSQQATQVSAARTGELWLLDRESGKANCLADGVVEPRCYPKCNYHSLVVYLRAQ